MNPRRIATVGAGALASLVVAAGCRAADPHGSGSERLRVVATFSILGDLVGQVGGDAITLHVLVGPDGDAHSFEPRPADGVVLAEADLVFENGLAFEPWLDDLYAASGSTARRVVVTDGLEARPAGGEAQSAAYDDGRDPAEFDPHMWQDVAASMGMVEAVAAALVQADGANAALYRDNATSYLAQLADLDARIAAQFAQLPAERRRLITAHDSLGYFARRYGFEVVTTVLGSSTADSADPAAGDIARLIDNIRSTGVPAVFAENVAPSDLMWRVAQGSGVKIVDTLYTDALGRDGTAGDTYIRMMSFNAAEITDALRP